jgi:hypothetical protein
MSQTHGAIAHVADVIPEDGELVATETRHDVFCAGSYRCFSFQFPG